MQIHALTTAIMAGALWAGPVHSQAQAHLTQVDSPFAFSETVQRIESILLARGLSLIAKVDHSAGAASVGMSLRPTVVLIFGNPKGSTPVMQIQPTLAIDLPLKALVWLADDGKVKVAVNAAELYQRHGLTADQTRAFGGV